MNKKLLAVAVAGVMAAPMAAQADVDVYGKLKVGVASVSDGTSSDIALQTSASRLGFKGMEDMGNGMNVIYQLEGEIFPDTSSNFDFGRNTFVGVKDSWGTVRMGKFDTAYKTITSKMDPFGDTVGDITGNGFLGTFDNREDDTVSYTNKFGNLWLGIDLHLTDLAAADMGNSIGVSYKMGSFTLAAANTTSPSTSDAGTATKIAAAMTFGGVDVNLINESGANTATNLSAAIKVGGKGKAGLSYTMAGANTQTSLGYFHTLAKSTKLNLVYSATVGDEGRIDDGVNGFNTATTSANAIQVQLAHNF